MFSILEVKRDARASIKEALGSVLLVSFVYVLIAQLLSYLGMRIVYGNFNYFEMLRKMVFEGVTDVSFLDELPIPNSFGQLLDSAMSIMSSVIAVGFSYYCLLISRRVKAGVGDMFDIFNIFFRTLGLVMLQAVYIMLWSLLFVIPGIIAAYRYSMAIYIMLDRPDVSVVDCIRLSKEMTYGNKGKIFLLELSFVLWQFASAAASMLFAGSNLLSMTASGIIQLLCVAYIQTSMANVYNRLSNWQPQPEAVLPEVPEEPWEE